LKILLDDKKKNDDENIERLLSMFKALIGFFLVPVMILLVFSDRSERRQDPSTVDPRFQTQQQQQQQQLLQFQQEPGNSSRIEDITWLVIATKNIDVRIKYSTHPKAGPFRLSNGHF
jgi:hypothetical protein